jgi:uncharacterized protein DUF3263
VDAGAAGLSTVAGTTAGRSPAGRRRSGHPVAEPLFELDELELEWASQTPVELAEPAEVARDAAAVLRSVTDDAAPAPVLGTVTDEQRAMLDFERQWWRSPGAKEQAIRDVFAISPTRYYQALNALLDGEAALRYDPQLVHRLRRLRTGRVRQRGRAPLA